MADTSGIRWNEVKVADRQGNAQQGQSFGGGATTTGDVAVYDANGNVIDGGVLLSTLTGAGTIISEVPVGLLNSINITFTLTFTPFANSLILFLNGVEQTPVDFALSANTITMTVAPKARDTGYWIARYKH